MVIANDNKSRPRRRGAAARGGKPTIRSVAERARVAVSTVSRVLNGGYASPEARARVEAAIQHLGYAPSVAAQSLVRGRAGCIGLVSYTSQATWLTQILAGIEEELSDSRQSVLLASLVISDRYDASSVSAWIQERRVDGLIFIRYTRRELPLFNAALQAKLPVVLIGPDVKAPASATVRCDNAEAGRLLGEHLLSLGHRRIAYAGGPHESIDSRDRLRGLSRVFDDAKLRISPKRVWFGPDYTPASGVEYARVFLRQSVRQRPTAVVLGNDAMALGFMRTVLSHDVQIPKQVSVAAFDGIPEGSLYWPGLTTVAAPVQRMGASGCRALLESIAAPECEGDADVHFGVELVVRESTGPVPEATRAGSG